MRSESLGKFHAHMPEAAQANNANLLSLANVPEPQRRICRNAGAQQRRCAGKIQLVGDAQNERLAHHDTVGVSAVSDAAENLVLSVIGESGEVNAELLLAGEAIDALSAGTDHAADACRISFFEFFDRAAGF